MKNLLRINCLIFSTLLASSSFAAEQWSPVLNVKLLFPQAKRENPNHVHSEKIMIALADMSWLPLTCTDRNYVYIEKTDSHIYSLLMAAMMSKATVQLSVTDLQPVGGVCRVTMAASPTWN